MFPQINMTALSGKDADKNKKEKFVPPTRVVVRRLPPTMSRADFEEQRVTGEAQIKLVEVLEYS